MAIDKLLKRHFWAVILLLVSVAAFFDAQGIMQVVGAALGADEKQLAAPPLTARLPPAPMSASPHATSAEAILARNPFDSVTGPLNTSAPVPSIGGPEGAPTSPIRTTHPSARACAC
jgi:general secretion pathway protein C